MKRSLFGDNPIVMLDGTPRAHAGLGSFEDAPDSLARLVEVQAILASAEQRAALTDDEVAALETELVELFDAVRAGTASGIERNDVEVLGEIADACDAVRAEAATRLAANEEVEAEISEIERRIRGESTDPAADPEADPAAEPAEADPAADPEADPAADPEADPAAEPAEAVSVSAGGAPPRRLPTLAELAARSRATVPAGRATGRRGVYAEHSFIRALERGVDVTLNDFAGLLIEKQDSFGAYAGGGEERIRLGRIDIRDRYPKEHRLSERASIDEVNAALDSVTAGAMLPESWEGPEVASRVASGGFCAPTEALYDIEQISGAQRPMRDGLPGLNAPRGGYRVMLPGSIADILVDGPSDTGAAVGTWTAANDLAAGLGDTPRKGCQHIACPTIAETFVHAIYRCLGFGNFENMTVPELVKKWTLDAAAAWARTSETDTLNSLSTGSTPITTTALFSSTIDLLSWTIQLAASARNRQRMQRNARLRAVFPSWIVELSQVDMMRRATGDDLANFEIDEAWIRRQLARANVNVTFYEDTRTGAGQIIGSQGAGADLRDFPQVVEWYLFHEGAHTFLDGATLDFGLVRDSVLNTTNDFRIFAENFQGLLSRPIFSYRVRSTVCPMGQTSGPIILPDRDIDTLCAAS